MSEYKPFLIRMLSVLVLICGAAYGMSLVGAQGFWKDLMTGLLSTTLGIIVSAMITYAIWLHQRNAESVMKRRQLVRDLQFEVEENLSRMANLDAFSSGAPVKEDQKLRVQGLRSSVMNYALRPENIVLLASPDLEDEIDWLVRQCQEFDTVLQRAFEKYWEYGAGKSAVSTIIPEATPLFRAEIERSMEQTTYLLNQLLGSLDAYDAAQAVKKPATARRTSFAAVQAAVSGQPGAVQESQKES